MFEEKEVILEAKNVGRAYITPEGKTFWANRDINLKFYRGKTTGIVGESGSGKSTLMKTLVGLEPPTTGAIFFKGRNITAVKEKDRREIHRHIQMVFQDSLAAFNPRMKVRDIICEPLLNYGKIKRKEKDQAAERLLEMVALPGDFAQRYPRDMSGGQRQRVGIARALALEPEVLLCDEATSSLDVSVQKSIMELLAKIQREKKIAIGFVSHDIALVSQISHQIAIMHQGEIVEVLPAENMEYHAKHPYSKELLRSVIDLHADDS